MTDLLDLARAQSFSYDALDRLDTAAGVYGTRDYDHDAIGNRTKVDFTGSSAGLIPQEVTSTIDLVYGEKNRLVRVDKDTVTVGAYVYNGLGERVVKTAGGGSTVFHYSPSGQLLAETDGLGLVQVEYVYLNGEPLAMIVPGSSAAVYYYHNDHLGTPQRMTDANQALVWDADYTPFGTGLLNVATVTNNLRFPGQYFDAETDLHYNYQRDYDPTVGRYTQSDPIGLDGGVNTYAYVDGNPLRFFDPFGLARKKLPNQRLRDCPRKERQECEVMCLDRGGVRSCKVTTGTRSVIKNGVPVPQIFTVPGSMSCECNEPEDPEDRFCPPSLPPPVIMPRIPSPGPKFPGGRGGKNPLFSPVPLLN